jgi:hypothetical protein
LAIDKVDVRDVDFDELGWFGVNWMSGHDPGCWTTDELAAGCVVVVVVDRAAASAAAALNAAAHVDSYVPLCSLLFPLFSSSSFRLSSPFVFIIIIIIFELFINVDRESSYSIIESPAFGIVSTSTPRYRPGILMPTG